MIRYWIKLLTSNDNCLPKKIYCMLKNDIDNGRTYNGFNWAYQIKSMLDKIGLSNIWIQQFEISIPYNLIKQRIFDMYKQSWYSSLHNDCNNVGQVCNPHEHPIAEWYMLRFIRGRLVFKIPTHLH